jgi:hypothetical protein
MASWIVHLRIAENLLELIPGLAPTAFAVGNIAPDSGIPDERWEKFNPPAEVTHFNVLREGWNSSADLKFYRSYLSPSCFEGSKERFSFRLGYFCHLVTDNLWRIEIGVPTTQRWTTEFEADKDFIWEVKKDWYGLDHIYVRDHPYSLFWKVFLKVQADTGGLDFLPLEAVSQRISYIQEFYQRKDEEIRKAYDREYIYLNAREMDRFVEASTQRLIRIYQQLWVNGCDPGELPSALDLVA